MKDIPPGAEMPSGGAAVAQIGEREFIVIGHHARIKVETAGANKGKPAMYARVEEGRFDGQGKWVMERNWNGDQTDHGLNLSGQPIVLRVRMGTY